MSAKPFRAKPMYNASDLARLFGCTSPYILKLHREGELPGRLVPAALRLEVPHEILVRYLEERPDLVDVLRWLREAEGRARG